MQTLIKDISGVNLLLDLNQESLPRVNEIGVDARAIAFTLGLSVIIATVLGLVPLLRFSARDLETSLREAGGGTLGFAGQHLRNLLLAGQMALTLILVVALVACIIPARRATRVDPLIALRYG